MHYPHHYPYYGGFYRGRSSRLIWFLIGAGATFWWFKHREAKGQVPSMCARHRLQLPATSSNQQNPGWPQDITDIPRAINNMPAATTPAEPHSPSSWKWDSDREHLENVSKQAMDAMANLTESTLESLLSTAESLKAKLAEHRAQREKQQKAIETQMGEERKYPPRLI